VQHSVESLMEEIKGRLELLESNLPKRVDAMAISPISKLAAATSVNAVSVGRRARQNSQVGIHDSRFTQSLLVHVDTCGRVVRDGIQHHRDF
jgi:hypothetical protein